MQKMEDHLYVVKRDGSRVPVSFDEITQRIRKLSEGLDHVNPDLVAQKVCSQLSDGVKTSELDDFAGEICAMMQARFHPNYGKLAARIVIDNHHKNTPSTLKECVETLWKGGIVDDAYYSYACSSIADKYQEMIDYSRDFMFDYFGFKTLERGYLLKVNGKVIERPQHMWMRVAIQLHNINFDKVKETYDALSQGYFIHATPTLFNSGTKHPQLSSCFLLTMDSDSIQGIYKTLGDCAQISKWAGGIGLHVHDVRGKGSYIKGTGGESDGLIPMMKTYNEVARWINQCFDKDTLITTKKGQVFLKDITINDEVLTIDGTYQKVYSVDIFDYEGELSNIKTENDEVFVKPDHPLLILQNCSDKTDDELKKLIHYKIIKPIWVDAEKITNNDIILSY